MERKHVYTIFIILLAFLNMSCSRVLYDSAIFVERKMASLSKQSIVVADHTIVYLEGGEGETILFLHGFGTDKDNWTRFAKFLTPTFHVVAIDLPGFGESTRIKGESYNVFNQTKRVDSIVEKLHLKNFHIVGHSMGGRIAGKYAADYSDKILSLAFFDTSGIYSCEKSLLLKSLDNGINPLVIKAPKDFERMLSFVFSKPPYIPWPVKKYLTNQAILHSSFNEQIFEEIMNDGYSLEGDLPKIIAKTFILWGDKDDNWHVSCVNMLEKGLSNSKAVIMKDCKHVPMIERPEEAAQHYLNFLKG